ncbi:MAG TPA: phenylalanine--tRNA ligase subunit beta, partial [Candidatus Limiplasma sp.]|nr:phenylalanine--tRNA ligase subunit beta [Candidatus Limiplasma sp.]
VKESGGDIRNEVKVSVLDPDLCPRYTARVVKNVRIAPSPKWLKKYLIGAGLRPINNIVDITNFVMIEYGHPMHAFDLSKVRGREIIVRRARDGETLTTLDDVERTFTPADLLICDAERATGIGGVMGGEESEITENTVEVMFECASFNRTAIRLTSRAQGMRTDASGRFERGVSPHTTLDAINRACMLVDMLDAGDVVTGVIDIYPNPVEIKPVTASVSRICERSGVEIPASVMVDILEKLQFRVKLDGDTLTVTAPPHRSDIETEADICEEVLRIYGFEEIGCTPLHGEQTSGGISPRLKLNRKVTSILHGMGYMEIMNFSFLSLKQIEKLNLAAGDARLDPLRVRNPLGEDSAVMRPTLAPDMLKTLSYNMNHATPEARLYEIAAVYDKHAVTEEGLPTETPTLCLGAYGGEMDFYAMRGAAEAVLQSQGIAYMVEVAAEPYLHPGRSAVLRDGDTVYATLGEVHPAVRDTFDMPARAMIAEINLALVQKAASPLGQLKPLPRFPSVARDLALVMEESVAVGPLMNAIRKAGGDLLEEVEMFDVYRSEQLGKGKKSVAFSLIFRAPDRTLTEPDVGKAMEKIQRSCAYQFGAVLR